MKIILAQVRGDDSDSTVLDAAYATAHRLKGHIKVVHVKPDLQATMPFIAENVPPSLMQDWYDTVERQLSTVKEKAHQSFIDWRRKHEVPLVDRPFHQNDATTAWIERSGDEYAIIAQIGQLSDLIVVSRPASEQVISGTLAVEAEIFGAGRPTLLMPPNSHFNPSTKALVAWDGSREATRALSLAVPLLQFASAVEIVTIAEADKHGIDAHAAAEYLGWHEIESSVSRSEQRGSVAETLHVIVRQRNAGILVMGAYTHTRIREMIFGGVTHHTLAHTEIPTFIFH